jgi:hypothetical protein
MISVYLKAAVACLAFATISLPSAFAADLGDLFNETVYVCTITSFTNTGDDMDVSFTWSSLEPGGSHGGSENTFTQGDDEIVAIGNDAWMGVAWWRSGKKIAEAVSLVSDRNQASRVLLLMHPDNDEERIHMDCTKPAD